MPICHFRKLIAALLLATFASTDGLAQSTPGGPFTPIVPISNLFPTGVTDGTFFANAPFGSIDPHYSISSAPGGFGPDAFVINPRPVSWVPNQPVSQWISPVAAQDAIASGLYFYETQFDLTGLIHTTATLSGVWTADDTSRVYLNGNTAGSVSQTTTFGQFDSFVFNSGFLPGVNTLTFEVDNTFNNLPVAGPSGLHVSQLSGEAAETFVPEPTSVLFLCGSVALARLRRRRR